MILNLCHEGLLPMLGLLVEALGELLEVLDLGAALPWTVLVIVLLLGNAGVVRAASLRVVVVPLGAVGNEVAWIATLKASWLGAVFLGHPLVKHASDPVVE